MSCVVVIDVGTRACRVYAVADGIVSAETKVEMPTRVPPDLPTAREWDPQTFWNALTLCTARIAAQAQAEAIVCTAQRLAYVFCDERFGALYAGPNSDARGFLDGVALARSDGDELARITGRHPPIVGVPARWAWFRENAPDVVSRTRWIMPLSDWIGARLTGVPAAEPSNGADTGLVDVETRGWSQTICKIANLDIDLLPPMRAPGNILGEVNATAATETGFAAGTPVVIGGADTACGLAGMGVGEPGQAAIVAGSTAPVEVVTSEPICDPGRRLWVTCLLDDDRWALDVSTGECGIAQRWLKEMLTIGSSEEFDAIGAQTDDSSGVMWHLTAPIDFSDIALGEFGQIRFARPLQQLGPNRAMLVRAFFENLAFSVRRALEWTDPVVVHSSLDLGGGFADSAVYPQVLADALGEPVNVHDIHVTARGAAGTALGALGAEPRAPEPTVMEPRRDLSDAYAAWATELDRLEGLSARFSALLD